MSDRRTEEREFDGIKVFSQELDFMSACDLLPEITAAIAPAFGDIAGADGISEADQVTALGRAVAAVASKLTGGKLSAILPKLLAGTVVILPDDGKGKPIKKELTSASNINVAFSGRKKLAVNVVKLALEVNFSDFFDVGALFGARAPTQ